MKTVRQQAQVNTQDRLVLSPDFEHELQTTIISAMASHTSMSEQLLRDTDKMEHFRALIAEMLFRSLHAK